MIKHVPAVYENGVLRPLEPLALLEHQQVTVTISDLPDDPLHSYLDLEYMKRIKKEVAAMDHIPTLEEVQAITSKDPASWSELIIDERKDRF